MKSFLPFNILSYFLFSVAVASTPVAKVEENYFTPQSFRSDFNQEFKSITGKVKSSKGTIEYSYPSKIRIKEFKDNSEFVSNEKNSWYYVPPFLKEEKGTVQIDQAGSMVLGKIFDSLHSGLKNTEFFILKKHKDEKKIELIFTEKGKKEWKLVSANLLFTKPEHKIENLVNFYFTYVDKKNIVLTFFNTVINIKFPSDYFSFKIPPNTQIVK